MRFASRLVLVALALPIGCGSTAAAPPRVVPPPARLHAGETWSAVVHARHPRALVIASTGSRRTFRLTKRGGAYRARVIFPFAGRWRYGVLAGGKTIFVGSVTVLPARLRLVEPFDVLEQPDGSYLIPDRAADAVYRLRGKELRMVARMPGPRDLEPAPDGRVLVASGSSVLSLDPAIGRAETVATAGNDILGVARAADGSVFASDFGSRILRFAGGGREVVATGLDAVHGLLAAGDDLVICESGSGRVLRLGPHGRLAVVAQGLDRPAFAAPAGAGAIYLSEFGSGRIDRVDRDGAVHALGVVPLPAAISVARDGRVLVASLTGRIASVEPATGRVTWLW